MLAASSLQYTPRPKSACFPPHQIWIIHVANAQPRPPSCDPCCSRALPAGRRPCSLAVMRAS
eukprot:scaffold80285_cov36-Phaeocystis_antarctica.AAC.1